MNRLTARSALSLAQKGPETDEGRNPHQNINDPRQHGALTAEDRRNQIKLKKPDKPPI